MDTRAVWLVLLELFSAAFTGPSFNDVLANLFIFNQNEASRRDLAMLDRKIVCTRLNFDEK